jgi:hypothetical protein
MFRTISIRRRLFLGVGDIPGVVSRVLDRSLGRVMAARAAPQQAFEQYPCAHAANIIQTNRTPFARGRCDGHELVAPQLRAAGRAWPIAARLRAA